MTDLGPRCEDHVGEAHPPRCAACDDALEALQRDALAGSLTSDPAKRAIYAEYLDPGEPWAASQGEPDPWGGVDGEEPF